MEDFTFLCMYLLFDNHLDQSIISAIVWMIDIL